MAVVIKNMDKPAMCGECRFFRKRVGLAWGCSLTPDTRICCYENSPEWCPMLDVITCITDDPMYVGKFWGDKAIFKYDQPVSFSMEDEDD